MDSVMWILLIKNTNINKQIYKNMFQINENIESGICYVDFAKTHINKQKNRICYMDFANVGICYVDFAMPHCVFFLMIVAKYRNVFSCFWYCTIQKKIAEMQKESKKQIPEMPAKRCKKLAKS